MIATSDAAVDTIAAVSTPPGRGGIGIVRLAGPAAIAIASRLCRLPAMAAQLDDPTQHARARRAQLLDITQHPHTTLDDVLVTIFFAPRSYTGDDLAEIAAHGAPIVLEATLRAAIDLGARLANPGEFTQRAFLTGRIDLTQAEAIHDLIAAQTLAQARVAAQQLGGALAHRVAPAKGSLLHLIALLEAGMDFASGELDDVDLVPTTQIAAAIEDAKLPLADLARGFRRGQLLRQGAAIALIGPPNAGKSSLFNRLLERDRAIVTAIPGTTRDTLEETLSLNGIPLRLIDTAGLRETSVSPQPGIQPERAVQIASAPYDTLPAEKMKELPDPHQPKRIDEAEALGIARTHEALADADLILMVHDATLPLSTDEQDLLATIATRPHIVIHNKQDLTHLLVDQKSGLPQGQGAPPLAAAMRASKEGVSAAVIRASALTGQGLDDLRSAILDQLEAEGSLAETALANNLRQQQHIAEALAALDAASAANTAGLPHEVLLLDLHAALRALDALTGQTTTDDILARIFSTFCIGK
jgi:tRNA modification GTPase